MHESYGEWCIELQYIGMQYLRGLFVWDFMAFAPSLLGALLNSPFLIMFRILRFSKLNRLLHKFDVLQAKIQTHYMRYQRYIYNVFLVIKAGFIMSCLVHFTICFFIFLSLFDIHGTEKGYIEIYDLGNEDLFYIGSYANMMQFVITTCTTVGYGAENVVSNIEKILAMLLMCFGSFMIAFIKETINKYWRELTLEAKSMELKIEAQDFNMEMVKATKFVENEREKIFTFFDNMQMEEVQKNNFNYNTFDAFP